MTYELPPVLQRIGEVGGVVFTAGAYNLNLFGIRSPSRQAGAFDDLMGCAYREQEDGAFRVDYWPATTDPGTYWLQHPMRVEGCAAVVADRQYRGLWKLGRHRNLYPALVQVGNVALYRDNDLDRVLEYDPATIMEGTGFGINGHRAGTRAEGSTVNSKWSAGCQVVARQRDFNELLALVHKSLELHPGPGWDRFTYTLLDRWW